MGTFSEKHKVPRFSLITVNFQSALAISRMVRSLPPLFLEDTEILIVNNDSDDAPLLSRLFRQQERIRVIDSVRNVGFGAACNRGAREAQAETLLFLNPDTRFVAGSLAAWTAEFLSSERSISAPIVMHGQQEEAWGSGKVVSPASILLKNIFPCTRFWSWYVALSLPDWISGAAFMMRRSDFMEVGGFDERFFLYYEDVDLCRRAQQAGLTICRSRQAVFEHHGGLSHSSHRGKKQAYFRSQDLYVNKYYGSRWVSLMRFLRRVRAAIFSWI